MLVTVNALRHQAVSISIICGNTGTQAIVALHGTVGDDGAIQQGSTNDDCISDTTDTTGDFGNDHDTLNVLSFSMFRFLPIQYYLFQVQGYTKL